MSRIIHLKISSDEPEKLIGFYSEVFGWQMSKFPEPPDGWRMESGDGPGINCSIYRSEDSPLERHLSMAISVSSVADSAQMIRRTGGTVVHDVINAFGNRYLYCQDPDGNLICLVEFGED